jgi:hypothetical protein
MAAYGIQEMSTCKRPFKNFVFGIISRSTRSQYYMTQTGVDITMNGHVKGLSRILFSVPSAVARGANII